MKSKLADQEHQISARLLACLLAGALIVVVAGLNLFEGGATEIGYEQFQQLLEQGLVKRITLVDDHMEIRLARAVRIEGLRGRSVIEHIQVEIAWSPSDDDVEAWREERGVEVVDIGDSGSASQLTRSILLGLVSVGLMAGGALYLIAQARAHRRRPGPRQRLRDAEADYLAGRITQEEYEREADCISAEL